MEYAIRNKVFMRPVGFLILCTLGVLLWPNSGLTAAFDPSGLTTARARWDAHHPTHYRMTIVRNACFSSRCTIDVEVQDEKIISSQNNGCSWMPQTVPLLFYDVSLEHVEVYDPNLPVSQVGEGLHIVYDAEYGYPVWMGYGYPPTTPEPRASHIGTSKRVLAVEDFTPLP